MDFTQRCSDADRDEAIKALSEHHAAGRIDLSEFDERSTAALAAKSYDDLNALFADLPAPRPKWLESLVPTTAPVARESSSSLARKRMRKWVSATQVVVWMAVLVMWLGLGVGGWWMIFVAVGATMALEAIYGEDDDRPGLEGGK